jgi:2-(1,2-epoxy-1,2-dihydrophenyl)acetyl-CoA isomerase
MTDTAPATLFAVQDGIASLTLNRPEVRNALNPALMEGIEQAITACRTNPSIRVLLIHGAGEGFMAGGDIRFFSETLAAGHTAGSFGRFLGQINLAVQQLRELPQPVIAAVHGACAGFGVSLMLAADLAIAGQSAKFTIAYDRLGLTPDGGASWHLVRMIGLRRASEWLLTGGTLSADLAAHWGLVSRVVPDSELMNAAQDMARRLILAAPEAVARTKILLNTAADNLLSHQLDGEAESFVGLTQQPDFNEGVTAFLEKRAPHFKGIR